MMRGTTVLWPYYISFVQYAYNNKVRMLTGVEPFVLMYGRPINEPHDYSSSPVRDSSNIGEWVKHQDRLVSLILPAIHDRVLAKQSDARVALDKLRKVVVKGELLPGTLVLIKDPTYLLNPSLRPSSQPPYIGPYVIVKRTLHGPYILRDDTGAMYGRHVPYDQMKVVHTAQSDDSKNQDDAFDVEYISDHRDGKEGMEYLIKWRGYDKRESSWEKEENINDIATVERYFRLVMAKQQAAAVVIEKKKGRARAKAPSHHTVVLSMTLMRC